MSRITTKSLHDKGHTDGRAWEAVCESCGEVCTTHSTTGLFPEDVRIDGGFWHEGPCRNARAIEWHEVTGEK